MFTSINIIKSGILNTLVIELNGRTYNIEAVDHDFRGYYTYAINNGMREIASMYGVDNSIIKGVEIPMPAMVLMVRMAVYGAIKNQFKSYNIKDYSSNSLTKSEIETIDEFAKIEASRILG